MIQETHIRESLVEAIRKEVIGPDPMKLYMDPDTKEERLLRLVHGAPISRYGAAMLYPRNYKFQKKLNSKEGETLEDMGELMDVAPALPEEDEIARGKGNLKDDSATNDSVCLANQYLPSAMGFTIFVQNDPKAKLKISVSSACYHQANDMTEVFGVDDKGDKTIKPVTRKSGEPLLSKYWTRKPLNTPILNLEIGELIKEKGLVYEKVLVEFPDSQEAWLKLVVYNRTLDDEKKGAILTFTLINESKSADEANILYQNEMSIEEEILGTILPYKEKVNPNDGEEEAQMKLLYRNKKIYGIGHGCALHWNKGGGKLRCIKTSFLPVYELPPVEPFENLILNMYQLSDKGNWEIGKYSLGKMLRAYEAWINGKEQEIQAIESKHHEAAKNNIKLCRENYKRIKEGIDLLKNAGEQDPIVKCFRWMNRAMLWQQQRSKTDQRKWRNKGKGVFSLAPIGKTKDRKHQNLFSFQKNSIWGNWRPFQLAFVLMNLNSVWNTGHPDREIVDLIWFPTGGGKTEAYLGLTAFTIFARRIKGASGTHHLYNGTAVLMRYTLRLLTTQQYERASSLICACDLIRTEHIEDLGCESISIGLWVGGSSTPNSRENASREFKKLSGKYSAYNFVVLKCPCCGAQIGKLDKGQATKAVKFMGLKKEDGKNGAVSFSCDNNLCDYYGRKLPLYVVDEDIYEVAPTLVFGTVDKFAMLPWKPQSGAIFGFRKEAEERILPPELIIQDELHLISGPLGTMVGLYETMIQTLCNDYGRTNAKFYPENINESFVAPKIVASTATISRAREQVKALYAMKNLNIFPPQGLEFGNTWFSEERTLSDTVKGRKYVGVLAPGYKSGQRTVVRVYAAILQAVHSKNASDKEKDFYWTLLGFFNSIRELGVANTLVYSHLHEYLLSLKNRKLLTWEQKRNIKRQSELTSRIHSDKIPKALKDLEVKYSGNNNKALDICLATNMIATGVDISRLGLIAIHGQPKTTAEYIQASSRVGRSKEGPGLVLALYSPSKPRDKSQYEHFQGYHSRLYSYVEPTSVTPFSIKVRERALHAVAIGLLRHFTATDLSKKPVIDDSNRQEYTHLKKWITNLILERCDIVNPNEMIFTKKMLEERFRKWENGYEEYGDARNSLIAKGKTPLICANNQDITKEIRTSSFITPTSMRGVDNECNLEIITDSKV